MFPASLYPVKFAQLGSGRNEISLLAAAEIGNIGCYLTTVR